MSRRLLPICALLLALAGGAGPAHAGINFWTSIGPDGGSINALVVSPAQPDLLYAGSNGAGLYRSEDGGATWVRASRGLEPAVMAVVADPQTPSTVYVVSDFAAMKSADAGATWTALARPQAGRQSAAILSLAIDPRSPSTLYAGTTFGIWKSTDGGGSWTQLTERGTHLTPIVVDPTRTSTLYAFSAYERALLRSTDSGQTWSEKDAGLPFADFLPDALQIALDPSTSPANVYVSFRDLNGTGITYRSTDAGETWRRAGPAGHPLAIGSGVIYAGAAISTDGGATWTPASAAPGTSLVFAAAPGSATTVYAGTSQGVWQSGDAAASWQAASHGLAATQTIALAVDPVHPRILFAAVAGAVQGPGLLKSGSGGQGWRSIGPPFLVDYLQELVVDPVTPSTLYAASSFGLAKSVDGGNTWEPLLLVTGCEGVNHLAIDPSHPNTLYVAGLSNFAVPCLALKSTDGGHSWIPLGLPEREILQIAVAPTTPATLYALGSTYVYKSTDAGGTWNRLRTPHGAKIALAIDPTDANRVFMSANTAIFRTIDGGRTWIEYDRKLPLIDEFGSFHRPTALAIDPHSSNIVYAAGDWGAYRSTNGGRTWYPIVAGLPNLSSTSNTPLLHYEAGGLLVPDPRQPGKLYAGTPYTGIYTYTIE
jgi:photosystem II stability/assembly factor-like uncharacterized protein